MLFMNLWTLYDLRCNRAEHCHTDEENRLHNESGPAIIWRFGTPDYYIHGVKVDAQIVLHPETQSLHQMQSEKNADIRGIRIERYGWLKYLTEAKAIVKDHRRNDIDRCDESLLSLDEYTILVCACPSTARIYSMRVPPHIIKCEEAQKWLYCNSRALRCIGSS